MDNKVKIMDITMNVRKGRMGKLLKKISGSDSSNHFVLEEFSKGWPESSKIALTKHIDEVRKACQEGFVFTDTDQIKSYLWKPIPIARPSMRLKQINRLKQPDLGFPLVNNVRVFCTGGLLIDRRTKQKMDKMEDGHVNMDFDSFGHHLGLLNEHSKPIMNQRMRVSACGPTYGTVYGKMVNKVFKDGKFMGPGIIKTAVLCNNCCDDLIGKYVRGESRRLDRIPADWFAEREEMLEKLGRQVKKSVSDSSSHKLPPRPAQVSERKPATNEVLRSRLEKQGVRCKRGMLKLDLIALCGKHGVDIY